MSITFTTLNIGANGVCVGCPTSHNVWGTNCFDVGRAKTEHVYIHSHFGVVALRCFKYAFVCKREWVFNRIKVYSSLIRVRKEYPQAHAKC